MPKFKVIQIASYQVTALDEEDACATVEAIFDRAAGDRRPLALLPRHPRDTAIVFDDDTIAEQTSEMALILGGRNE